MFYIFDSWQKEWNDFILRKTKERKAQPVAGGNCEKLPLLLYLRLSFCKIMNPAWIFIVIGIMLISIGFLRIIFGYFSGSWPKTTAEFLSTSIEGSTVAPDGKGRAYILAKVEYVYYVHGTRYMGRRISFGIRHNASDREARSELVDATKERQVYYCPPLPSLSVLIPGIRTENVVLILVGILFLFPLLRYLD